VSAPAFTFAPGVLYCRKCNRGISRKRGNLRTRASLFRAIEALRLKHELKCNGSQMITPEKKPYHKKRHPWRNQDLRSDAKRAAEPRLKHLLTVLPHPCSVCGASAGRPCDGRLRTQHERQP
jgi:hypothetical protein